MSLCISDGKNSDLPYRTNQLKAYFPPPDQWLYYTVTFNGRAVEFYRDGIHVETRFQTLIPDTANVPMLIGKCFGMGGPSDFFKGLLDEVRVYNRPLSSPEIYELYMKDAVGREKPVTSFGAVGITAAAYSKPGIIFADLDYRGLLAAPEDVDLAATLDDANGAEVVRTRIKMLPAWGRAEAIVDASNLPVGSYTLRVAAATGKPRAATIKWPGRVKGWEDVKVLNSFCWELLSEAPGRKPAGNYKFNNPRRGWVYVATEVEGDLTLTMRGAKPEIVHAASKATKPDATAGFPVMRWLDEGPHTIAVSGSGKLKRLVVRAVPMMLFWLYPCVGPGTGADSEFLIEHVLSPYNIINTHNYDASNKPGQFLDKWANELGRHLIQGLYPATYLKWNKLLKDDTARQQIWDQIAPHAGMNGPTFQGVSLDEFTAGNDRIMWTKSYYDEWIETCAKMLEDPKYAGRFIMPAYGYNMYDFEKSTAFLRMFIAHGSPLVEEWYLTERDTEEQAWIYINESAAAIEHRWRREIPGYTENAIKLLSYLQREIFNPGVDFKVHLEMQFEHFATRLEFFGLGGIGAYSSYNCNNGEYVRWVSELCRHYGLEGKTERLGTDPYECVQIRNPTFTNGTDNWALRPAERDSMAVKSHQGYGDMQERYPYRPWTDTTFLWSKRSAGNPNRFSQEIPNLEAGRLYFVRLWIGDYADLMAGALKGKACAVNMSVEGGEVWDDWYRTEAVTDKGDKGNAFAARGCQVQQLIFRAKGPTATLNISDWESDTKPGGPIGRELIFNDIDAQPYLEP